MKIIINNIATKIISSGQDDLYYSGIFTELRNYLSVNVPGAFFTPAYKRRGWDGKRYFLTPGGKMATGFLPLLLKHIDRDYPDLQVEIIDDRGDVPKFRSEFKSNIGPIKINKEYEHQRRMIESMNSFIEFRDSIIPFPRGIINASTNAGKTAAMAGVHLNLDGDYSMLVLIHRKDIFTQLVTFFEEVYGEVGVINMKKYDPKNITVGMIKTVFNRLESSVNVKKDLAKFDVVAVDECHLAGSKTFTKVLQNVQASVRVFVSGTPFDSDAIVNKMMAIGLSGPELIHISKRELMDKGISLKAKIYMHLCHEYVGLVPEFNYDVAIDTRIHKSAKRAAIMADICRKHKGSTLIAVNEIEHGQLLYASLQLLGIKSIAFVHGTDKERDSKIQDFKDGKIQVLISTQILKEGVNIPIVSNIIYAAGKKAKVDIKQWMGRGERLHGKKTEFTMHDFYDIGEYVEAHSKKRLVTYKDEKLEVITDYDRKSIRKIKQMTL